MKVYTIYPMVRDLTYSIFHKAHNGICTTIWFNIVHNMPKAKYIYIYIYVRLNLNIPRAEL